jgi:hypothetical protein
VNYQWLSVGLSQFVKGTANWQVMGDGEECSQFHYCKLAALWGRCEVIGGNLWADC